MAAAAVYEGAFPGTLIYRRGGQFGSRAIYFLCLLDFVGLRRA